MFRGLKCYENSSYCYKNPISMMISRWFCYDTSVPTWKTESHSKHPASHTLLCSGREQKSTPIFCCRWYSPLWEPAPTSSTDGYRANSSACRLVLRASSFSFSKSSALSCSRFSRRSSGCRLRRSKSQVVRGPFPDTSHSTFKRRGPVC